MLQRGRSKTALESRFKERSEKHMAERKWNMGTILVSVKNFKVVFRDMK
jgi:hypothetical protein